MENNFTNLFSKKVEKYRGFFFILGFNMENEQFLIGIKKDNSIIKIGVFSKGLSEYEKRSLTHAILQNQERIENKIVLVEPGICVELSFQAMENNQLINPKFETFNFELNWEHCTWERLVLDNTPLHNEVSITHTDKKLWGEPYINKEKYISYLIQIAPLILPFLRDRIITVIRYPHGIPGESFYQKNCPDYAPRFINTKHVDGINYIVCNDLSTLIWLGNQLAIEFHVPFQNIGNDKPLEIVFDLDPPNKSSFHLAIKAAKEIKVILDSFEIKSFPKLSGNKGIQIHIPTRGTSLSYNETRIFTSFIARYLVEKFPEYFTIERLKKNRGNRLYIDYIQHAEGKTIICPYSTRGNEKATVAAPLNWEEVNDNLRIEKYTVPFVLERVLTEGCPFKDFFVQENPTLIKIINSLKEKINFS